jgi:predicted MFS family arabinose efflux permease
MKKWNRWQTSQTRQFMRSLSSGIGKSHVIFPSAFLVALTTSIIELGIIFYIKEIFDATPSEVGYFTALWSFCYILGCASIRPLFNRVLPRYLLIGSAFLMSLFLLLILFAKRFAYAYLFYGLYAVAMSFFWPPIMGWLSQDVEGEKLGKSMSYYNISWNIGLIIGPLPAGFLSSISPSLPLYAGSLLCLLTGVLITAASFLVPKIRTDRGVDAVRNGETARRDASTVLRYPGWVGLFTTFVVMGVVINIFPVYARDDLLLRKETIGLLMQSRTFIALFVFFILGRTAFWHFRISQMVAGQVVLACVVFTMSFITSPFLFAVQIALIGGLRALSFNNSLFHGVSGSVNRTARMAAHEALLAGGLICGSALGGRLYQNHSIQAVYYFSATCVLVGAAVQAAIYLALKRKQR